MYGGDDFVLDDCVFCFVIFELFVEFLRGVEWVVFDDDGVEMEYGVECDDVLWVVG